MGQAVMGSVTFLAAALAGMLAGQFEAPMVAGGAGLTAAVVGFLLIRRSPSKIRSPDDSPGVNGDERG
jgi:hypothetical protein